MLLETYRSVDGARRLGESRGGKGGKNGGLDEHCGMRVGGDGDVERVERRRGGDGELFAVKKDEMEEEKQNTRLGSN